VCQCLIDLRRKSGMVAAGIPVDLQDSRLSEYQARGTSADATRKVVKKSMDILSGGKFLRKPVFIAGKVNRMLLVSLLIKAAVEGGFGAKLVSLHRVNEIQFGNDSEFKSVHDMVAGFDVLCVEIGLEITNRFSAGLLQTIFQERLKMNRYTFYSSEGGRQEVNKRYGAEFYTFVKQECIWLGAD